MAAVFERSLCLSKSWRTWNSSGGEKVQSTITKTPLFQKDSTLNTHSMNSDRRNEQRLFNMLKQQQQQSRSESPADEETLQQLAEDLWDNIRDLYYHDSDDSQKEEVFGRFPNGPVILGMERCPEFRRKWGSNGTIGVASLFNAGSNAFTKNLQSNLGMPGNNDRSVLLEEEVNLNGVWAQVPWWKHNPMISDPINGRMSNWTHHASVLPIIIVRDFYFWRKSTCTASYDLEWDRGRYTSSKCPGFVMRNATLEQDGAALASSHSKVVDKHEITFRVEFDLLPQKTSVKYPSLAAVWNAFHRQYLDASFPRLLIRFEDTLFYLPEIIQSVQECAGASWKSPKDLSENDIQNTTAWSEEGRPNILLYKTASKAHGNSHQNDKRSYFLTTIQKNANPFSRLHDMNKLEQDHTRHTLDPELMRIFHYTHPGST